VDIGHSKNKNPYRAQFAQIERIDLPLHLLMDNSMANQYQVCSLFLFCLSAAGGVFKYRISARVDRWMDHVGYRHKLYFYHVFDFCS